MNKKEIIITVIVFVLLIAGTVAVLAISPGQKSSDEDTEMIMEDGTRHKMSDM